MGANDAHTIRTFLEAEAYDGPSLLIAYSHCIAHGINMRTAMNNQKLAVQCGHWPLFRFNPERAREGKNPLQLDSKAPSIPFAKYAETETRYKMLTKIDPAEARRLHALAQQDAEARWKLYEQLAGGGAGGVPQARPAPAAAPPTTARPTTTPQPEGAAGRSEP
jgi:pyruvate-ferredoxin/flavodoxin oxidoreductase